MLDLILQNLLSPAILFFILGTGAGYLKSDLNVPETMGRYLGIYLMMSIGFKGGVSMSNVESFNSNIIGLIIVAILLSSLIPFLAFQILKFTTNLSTPNAAALSAHYGSVSVVTFAAAVNFLQVANVQFSGYMVTILAIMEAPAILSGLYLAHSYAPETNCHAKEERKLAKEIFANGAVLLITGSLIIGAITGEAGLTKLSGFLVAPFQGVLCLFLLDMGLVVTKNLHHLRNISSKVIFFGIYMPLICSILALIAGKTLNLQNGDIFLLIVLAASSSYIAVPAAMRLALPEAEASLYMPISLGITFPMNIIAGIPIYYFLSNI